MVAWLKALLFVAGGVIAAAGTAYVTGLLDPWIDRPAVIASLPEGGTAPSENGEGANAGADAKQDKPVVDDSTIPGDPSTTDKQSRLIAPSFDVVRVEPDGSLLIAGEAAAGSTVEVLSGDSVLGSGSSGEAGDFVIVLDEPLKPGDYQIALRTTTDGAAAMSTQTALVSVPDSPDGEVLALVEEPGEPSRLITKPEGEAVATPDVPAMPDEDRLAMEGQAAGEDDAGQPATGSDAASVDPDEPKQDIAANEVAQDEPPADQADVTTPGDGSQTPGERAVQADDDAQVPASNDDAAEIAGDEPASDQQIAGLPAGEQSGEAEDRQSAGAPNVLVEAVEIEGDTVFVAGQADPGSNVRIYANDIHLGDARASDGGRFLVEAQRDLPVGDYVIRADVLAADGTVLARAAVPFEREPGESIAAVAVQPGAEESASADTDAAADMDASNAPEQSGTAIVAEDSSSGSEGQARETSDGGNASATGTDSGSESSQQGGAPAGLSNEAVAGAEVDGTASPAAGDERAAEAADEIPDEGAGVAAGDEPSQDGLTAPRLQRVDGAVIIRRGDTLWRISRRVYGMGIRYSTIYLANQDQISDPDRIWPGQVFSVPEETADGVSADMKAIGEQAVPADTESRIIR